MLTCCNIPKKLCKITKTPKTRIVVGISTATFLFIFVAFLNAVIDSSFTYQVSFLLPTAVAQISQNIQSDNSDTQSSTSSSSLEGFRFTYLKIGISNPNYQRIAHDSNRNIITIINISAAIHKNTESGTFSSTQAQSQSQSNKQISDADEIKLQRIMEQDGFFETDSIYPPPNRSVTDSKDTNYNTLYILSVELNSKHHTALWTDISQNIPTGLSSILEAIEDIGSK